MWMYFLCWLSLDERYSSLIKGAKIRNSVIDLASMFVTTDIPDWVYGQHTGKEISYPLVKMTWKSYLRQVKFKTVKYHLFCFS